MLEATFHEVNEDSEEKFFQAKANGAELVCWTKYDDVWPTKNGDGTYIYVYVAHIYIYIDVYQENTNCDINRLELLLVKIILQELCFRLQKNDITCNT